VPRLGGGVAHHETIATDDLAAAFRPVIDWIVDSTARAAHVTADTAPDDASATRHVANRFYREND
jgi:hypothetical protein